MRVLPILFRGLDVELAYVASGNGEIAWWFQNGYRPSVTIDEEEMIELLCREDFVERRADWLTRGERFRARRVA